MTGPSQDRILDCGPSLRAICLKEKVAWNLQIRRKIGIRLQFSLEDISIPWVEGANAILLFYMHVHRESCI